ncbi:lipoate--protein ligase family protein [Paenibacillus filicis]|uniref:Lipoate--protein ligase family protein n=1 Tax=Paenibacillus gyeongsangnamensis TaxID=3388067 RepID=A0ABT4QCW1_9BACL|nr:lipoate--protein ligase family protein [Paenibacillus filicis]MCZ8514670.1 lipoate--protein ligase family protein [Paenibacillus filicis]
MHAEIFPPETLLLDRMAGTDEADVLYPFALEELLCRYIGEGGPPIVHLWRHPRALVMGLRDSRLPGAAAAKRWLEEQGYAVGVRNSGGAAVPLDFGVVNVTLMLPIRRGPGIGFRDDFERMYLFISEALKETGMAVDKGEIQGAFCPGDFDLSIGGRKFCGIAQRRQAKAFAIQAFVITEGNGKEKADLARQFYDIAAEGADERSDHPRVSSDSMASLEELTGLQGGAAAFADAVKRVVREGQAGSGSGTNRSIWLPGREEVRAMAEQLRQRYGIKETI